MPIASPYRQEHVGIGNRALWWSLLTLLLLIAWDASGLDLPVARAFSDGHHFPLQDHWLLTRVLHEGVLPVAWLLVGWITIGVWFPTFALKGLERRKRLGWALSTWLPLVVVNLMKITSKTSCPWDLTEFGGAALRVSHWAWGLSDGGPGHCFPAGHATAGFAFIAGYFAWHRTRPALARGWLLGGLVAGSVLGLSQQLRGAHYVSHTLWTAWLCWSIPCAIEAVSTRWPRAASTGTAL
ncbi:MAG: (acid phosphatase) superfamily protein-like protein [Ramlibacter sp.]|nr:(acid phosphatase) superfamily protein-like protein [Ramlibacter sp.]